MVLKMTSLIRHQLGPQVLGGRTVRFGVAASGEATILGSHFSVFHKEFTLLESALLTHCMPPVYTYRAPFVHDSRSWLKIPLAAK